MKWHHKWAHGYEKEEWLDLGPVEKNFDPEETIQELAQEYGWSDKYRGVGYELIEMPPPAVIEAHLQRAERLVSSYQKRVLELQELLKKVTT